VPVGDEREVESPGDPSAPTEVDAPEGAARADVPARTSGPDASLAREQGAVTGRVESMDGRPVPGAAVLVRGPRTRPEPAASASPADGPTGQVLTDRDGAFRWGTASAVDLLVEATGFAAERLAAVEPGTAVRVVLRPGRTIEGRASDRAGRPVDGAVVEVVLAAGAPETVVPPAPVRSGADGGFRLDAVPLGAARVRARHPAYMDGEAALDAAAVRVSVTLAPALVAWFRATAPDGRPVEEAEVTASSGTFGVRARELTLAGAAAAGAPERGLLGPLKIPADTGAETLIELRVPGYSPWSIETDAPANGGARVFDVPLVRVPEQGRARVRLRGEDGAALPWTPASAPARIVPREGVVALKTLPRLVDGDLVFEGVPPGTYRVTVISRGHAPAVADVEVRPDEESVVDAAFRPEARARVRVLAPGGRRVRIRLTRDERPVPVHTDPAPRPEAGVDPWAPSFFVGEEGVLVGGLDTGPYVVEVLSPDLAAVGARFEARAGETLDVEVRPVAR
jgi:hypothetical protein